MGLQTALDLLYTVGSDNPAGLPIRGSTLPEAADFETKSMRGAHYGAIQSFPRFSTDQMPD